MAAPVNGTGGSAAAEQAQIEEAIATFAVGLIGFQTFGKQQEANAEFLEDK